MGCLDQRRSKVRVMTGGTDGKNGRVQPGATRAMCVTQERPLRRKNRNLVSTRRGRSLLLRRNRGRANVSINVPLSAVEPLLSLVPHSILSDGLLDVAGHDVPVNIGAMRSLWRAVADVGDAEFLTVEAGDETVRVARTGDQIHVQMEECEEDGGETVEIQLPVVVIDALLSGDGETFNVPAAVERLSELRGDIVRVTGGEHQMRIWVDEVAHPSL